MQPKLPSVFVRQLTAYWMQPTQRRTTSEFETAWGGDTKLTDPSNRSRHSMQHWQRLLVSTGSSEICPSRGGCNSKELFSRGRTGRAGSPSRPLLRNRLLRSPRNQLMDTHWH